MEIKIGYRKVKVKKKTFRVSSGFCIFMETKTLDGNLIYKCLISFDYF